MEVEMHPAYTETDDQTNSSNLQLAQAHWPGGIQPL